AVEVRGRHDGDEELRTVGAAAAALAGVRHGEQVGTVELELRVDLVVEVVARATGTGAQRVAALDHEAGDDAVEHGLVVERARVLAGRVGALVLLGALGEADEVVHGLRRMVAEEIDADVTVVGVDDGGGGLDSHPVNSTGDSEKRTTARPQN